MGMRTKAATKDLVKFFFVGNVWLLGDSLITRSPGCSDSFLPSGVIHLATVHCFILGTRFTGRFNLISLSIFILVPEMI